MHTWIHGIFNPENEDTFKIILSRQHISFSVLQVTNEPFLGQLQTIQAKQK